MNQEWTPTQEPEPRRYETGPVAVAMPRTGQARIARIGLLGIAAAALVAVAVLAFGVGASPAGTLAADTGPSNGLAAGDWTAMGGPGGPGMGDHGPGIGGGVTITAIAGSNVSLTTTDGWTRTISVDSGTTYSQAGATIALGDVQVGDQIAFRQTLESDGSYSIDSITVVLPRLGGQVTALSGSTITVEQRDGSTATIEVTGSTTYDVNGASGALSDITTGMVVMAEGNLNSDGSLTALEVHAGTMGFRGDHGGRGPGHDWDGDAPNPDATAAPTSDGSAS